MENQAVPSAPEAPDAPEVPDFAEEKPDAELETSQSDDLDDAPEPVRQASSAEWNDVPAEDPAVLLRRAMGVGEYAGAAGLDDCDLRVDESAQSVRELRALTRLAIIAIVGIALLLALTFTGALDRHQSLIAPAAIVCVTTMCTLGGMLILGLAATLRRGSYVWLVLGIMCTPLAYALWAAVTLRSIRIATEEGSA
jgi:hypothetical protein